MKPSRVIQLGMAGAGKMAYWHLRAYRHLPRVQIAAICNPHSDRGIKLARHFHIPRVFRSYEEMLHQVKLDAVDLCTPTAFHAPQILSALKMGLHVYTEKPMCRTVEEAEEIVEANKKNRRVIFNGYNLRTWPPIMKLTRMVESGRLGEIRFVRMIRTTYEFPGSFMENPDLNAGIINEFTGHFIDLLQAWDLGSPAEVTAAGSCALGPYGDPDTVSVYFHYPNGAGVLMHNSLGVPGITPEILVAGRERVARLIRGKVLIESQPRRPSLLRSVWRAARPSFILPYRFLGNPFRGSTRYFAGCILKGGPNFQDEVSALHNLRLACLATRSQREGKRLRVPDEWHLLPGRKMG